MEIRIQLKNNRALVICFGRELSWCSQLYLITITVEHYKERQVVYANWIKGFFRKKA